MHIPKSVIFTSEKYQKCYFACEQYQLLDNFRFLHKFPLLLHCLTSELQTLVTSLLWIITPSVCVYRKNPKISDTRKFAVITLKVKQDGLSLE